MEEANCAFGDCVPYGGLGVVCGGVGVACDCCPVKGVGGIDTVGDSSVDAVVGYDCGSVVVGGVVAELVIGLDGFDIDGVGSVSVGGIVGSGEIGVNGIGRVGGCNGSLSLRLLPFPFFSFSSSSLTFAPRKYTMKFSTHIQNTIKIIPTRIK